MCIHELLCCSDTRDLFSTLRMQQVVILYLLCNNVFFRQSLFSLILYHLPAFFFSSSSLSDESDDESDESEEPLDESEVFVSEKYINLMMKFCFIMINR